MKTSVGVKYEYKAGGGKMTRQIIDILLKRTLEENKIPNLKHQITNISQFPVLNDQNSHQSFSVSLREPNSKDMVRITTALDGSIVWIFEFGHWDLFDIWCLEFPIASIPKIQIELRHAACGRWPARDR